MLTKEQLVKTPEYWLETVQNELFRQVTAYMKEKKINQTQLAQELGVSKGYISQVLNGNFNFTLSKLIELSLAIGRVPNLKFEKIKKDSQTKSKVVHNAADELKLKSPTNSKGKPELRP